MVTALLAEYNNKNKTTINQSIGLPPTINHLNDNEYRKRLPNYIVKFLPSFKGKMKEIKTYVIKKIVNFQKYSEQLIRLRSLLSAKRKL